MELEDRCEDEILLRLKLEEELAAINKDGFTDPDGVFAFNLDQPDALDMPLEEDKGSKKLPAFPEMIQDQLPQRIKRYKDQAVKRKSTFKQADERLTSVSSDGFGKLVMMLMMLRMEHMFVGAMWVVKMMMGAMVC